MIKSPLARATLDIEIIRRWQGLPLTLKLEGIKLRDGKEV